MCVIVSVVQSAIGKIVISSKCIRHLENATNAKMLMFAALINPSHLNYVISSNNCIAQCIHLYIVVVQCMPMYGDVCMHMHMHKGVVNLTKRT